MTTVPKEIRSNLTNVDAGKGIYLQYEPAVVSGSVRATYGGETPLAAAHSPMIFASTQSETFQIEMRWERIPLVSKGKTFDEAADVIDSARRFVRSLLQPKISADNTIGGEPPLCFLEVPGVYSVYCRLESIDWDVPRRDPRSGRIVSLKMKCTFRETPEYSYSAEEINVIGYNRT